MQVEIPKAVETHFGALIIWVISLVTIGVLDLLWAFPMKWTWNYVAPLFSLPLLTWGHAWCLKFLVTMLTLRNVKK